VANDFASRLIPVENTQESQKESDFKSRLIPYEKELSRTRSLINAPSKGLIKGVEDLSSLANPLNAILPKASTDPLWERGLPTKNEPLEKGLERAGRIAPSLIGGPGSIASKGIRGGAAALLGQLAEESGAPEWGQTLAELSAFMSPKFGGKLLPKKSQKDAVEFLRNKGLTDKEIVPLVKSQNLLNKSLEKISAKGQKTEELRKNIRGKLGSHFDVLKKQGEERFLHGKDAVEFDNKLSGVVEKINPRFSRSIEKDLEALRNKGISQKNLIDFYQDINAIVGKQDGGKAVLGILKKPILEGLHKIDPEAANQFSRLNEFYAKAQRFAKGMKENQIEKLFSAGKTLGTLGALATGNFPFLGKVVGTHALQVVSREFLLNPRLQNLSLQMLQAIKNNNIPSALRTMGFFEKEIRKVDKKAADAIHRILSSDSDLDHPDNDKSTSD
jgi:hypothetical protein